MIFILLINISICILILKLLYHIFEEKILYPFRVAEIYAYCFSNLFLFFFNYNFHSLYLSFLFLFLNSLIFYIFYHLVNMIQTSPRTKILMDLLEFKKINIEEYNKLYNLKVIVENRLERFESSNQIEIKQDQIVFNDKKSNFLKLLSIIFLIIKKL